MKPHPTAEQLRQYEALRTKAALASFEQRGELVLSGADCASFLHNFCTNDIKGLSPGSGCEAFFCNLQGKTLGHGYIFRDEESLAIGTVAAGSEALAAHLDRYLIREDVAITDRTSEVSKLLLCGPEARELLTTLTGGSPGEAMLSQQHARIGGLAVQVRCLPYVAPRSYCVVCDRPARAELHEKLISAGAVDCQPDVLQAARIESGTPVYGVDITESNLPQEVGRDEQAISFQKGCYLGQETVARIDALGHVNRQLVGVRLSGESLPPAETDVTSDGQPVGQITSATWSPRLEAVLALAYVKSKQAQPGSLLTCDGAAGEVVSLPCC